MAPARRGAVPRARRADRRRRGHADPLRLPAPAGRPPLGAGRGGDGRRRLPAGVQQLGARATGDRGSCARLRRPGGRAGGRTARLRSSFATPVVTGVAALLLSVQLEEGGRLPRTRSARRCWPGCGRATRTGQDPGRCLAGRLDVTQTLRLRTTRNPMSTQPEPEGVTASCGVPGRHRPPRTPRLRTGDGRLRGPCGGRGVRPHGRG